MKFNFLFALVFLISYVATAKAQTKELEEIDEQNLDAIEYDLMLNDAKVAQEIDEVSGIALKSFNTSFDKGRYSFLYHTNINLPEFSNISGFEFIFSKRYEWAWIELSVVRTSALMQNISVYNSNINTPEPGLFEETHAITEVGIGLSYRTKYLQEVINSSNLFETIAASLQYVNFSENYFQDSYNGIGLKTDFGLHFRSSKAFHYGLKMSTHLASVKKSETVAGESDTNRALLLRWISLAADLSFYY